MAGAQTVDVSTASRYKDTGIYSTYVQFGPVFALMELPKEFAEPREDETVFTVRKPDVGFLDQIAVRHYGPGSEKFWWVIALVNRIIDPDLDMFVNQSLRVPSRATVLEFSARVGNG
jgi:hypothetical protein